MNNSSHLHSFTVKDFKSYQHGTLQFAPLTLLIGTNASGKSNLLEAIRLLSWMAQGRRLDHLFRAVTEDDAAVRGSVGDLPRRGCLSFVLSCTFDPIEEEYDEFTLEIRVEGAEVHIQREQIGGAAHPVPLYTLDGPADGLQHDVQVAYNNFARGGHKPHITCTDQQLVLTQLTTPARLGENHRTAQRVLPAVTRGLAAMLSQAVLLDPEPRRMRGYIHESDTELNPDGSNLSGVLHGLCATEAGKEQVLGFIRHLPERDIADLEFVETPRKEVMVSLTEEFGGRRVRCDAPLLSDGTLRVLAVAAAALSAPEGALVVVEEIDNGVHPSRAHLLMERLRQVADDRRLRIVITSHNPALLDAVPDDLAGAVTCCYRDPGDGSSQLVRLADLDQYPELLAEGPLGYLMARGRIESYLHDQRSPAQRRDQALEWLAALKGDRR